MNVVVCVASENGSLQLHALWRGTTGLELTFPHEIVDLAEEFLRSISLGDKPSLVGNVGRGRFHLTGCDHQQDVRPTRVDFAGQVQSITTGHLNVSEEQPHAVVGLHDLERGFGASGLHNLEAVVCQESPSVEPQNLVVVTTRAKGGSDSRIRPNAASIERFDIQPAWRPRRGIGGASVAPSD